VGPPSFVVCHERLLRASGTSLLFVSVIIGSLEDIAVGRGVINGLSLALVFLSSVAFSLVSFISLQDVSVLRSSSTERADKDNPSGSRSNPYVPPQRVNSVRMLQVFSSTCLRFCVELTALLLSGTASYRTAFFFCWMDARFPC
jgi:hypothetical protein